MQPAPTPPAATPPASCPLPAPPRRPCSRPRHLPATAVQSAPDAAPLHPAPDAGTTKGTTKGYPHFWIWPRASKCSLPAICSKNSHTGKSKKASSREKKETGEDRSTENKCDADEETVEEISSVDEDCSRGMKKWLLDYHQRRPGSEILQQRLDEFLASYEAEEEQVRKEREAVAAGEGWTVVVHHKGRKKTTDPESGIAVGSVAQAAIEDKMAKKKQKELALDFYRFQKREAQRNEVLMLQSKFEHDKKRLQQLRAARKFCPY